jgi:RNA polymerase sigma factor (sigma-70 family)
MFVGELAFCNRKHLNLYLVDESKKAKISRAIDGLDWDICRRAHPHDYGDYQWRKYLWDKAEKILSPREFEILRLYFGDDTDLETIAGKWNLTRERIRQMKDKALRKLRYYHGGRLKELLQDIDHE